MKKWKMAFWTPSGKPENDGKTFGCASNGFSTADIWQKPDEKAAIIWDTLVEGEVLSGNYAEVLDRLQKLSLKPKGFIAVFPRNSGIESFIEKSKTILGNIPMIGGVAAFGPGQSEGEIIPHGEDVAVLLVYGGEFHVETQNIHEDTGRTIKIKAKTSRVIEKIISEDGMEYKNAIEYYRKLQKEFDLPPNDFECITFSDKKGRNLHCSLDGKRLKCGADLPEDSVLIVRTSSRMDASREVASFFSKKNALVFGCAGLRLLMDHPIFSGHGTLAGFMFGELVTIGEEPMFGNLMMARLTLKKIL